MISIGNSARRSLISKRIENMVLLMAERLEKLRRIAAAMERSARAIDSDKYRQLRAEIADLEKN